MPAPTRRRRAPAAALLTLITLGAGCAAPLDDPLDDPLDARPSAADAAIADPPDADPIDAFEPPPADAMIIPRPDAADLAPEPEPDAAPLPDPEPDAAPPPEGPPPYPADRSQSPMTPWIIDRLHAIADRAPRAPDVFAKIGDSVTVSAAYLRCFGTDAIQLDGRDALWPTIEHFQGGDAAGTDPFRRQSEAATVGWSVQSALRGDPAPLDVELDLLDPRFATVMFGTNDIQSRDIDRYATELWTLVDRLIDGGTIPILSTIMPRDDDPGADALVPRYNAVARAIAQGRAIPLVGLHRALLPLPDHGLGPDRLHPSVAPTGACDLGPAGLDYGYNIRNLLTVTALDRARRALDGQPAPDPPFARPPATGGVADPFVIDRLPFTDLRDTADGARALDRYPGCDAPQDESGPEFVYALHLDRPTVIRARVFDRGAVDVDLHLLAAADDPGRCLDRDHQTIEASLTPGTWYFVLDTYVDGGVERAGEYLFTLIAD